MTRLRPVGALVAALAVLVVTSPPAVAGPETQPTWHADQARVPDAREAGRGGEGVVVAVLDSWVDRGHPDLAGRVLAGADCVGGTCRPGPAPSDACDHGTHVSGTVASSSLGVAPRARILPVRVLAHDAAAGDCTGEPGDVAAGIRWAVASGARVLNLSLGPDVPGLAASSAIPAAVAEAARAGAVVIFSAGNASLPVTDAYRGKALVVAATGPTGELASYSQRGVGVDLAAPGGDPETTDVCSREECVLSLFPGGGYSVAAGTSMAAPHVSGVAALLLGQDPARSRDQVVEQLLGTARPLAQAGRGLLDARAALRVTGAPPAAPRPAPATAVVRPSAAPPTSPGRLPAPSPVPAGAAPSAARVPSAAPAPASAPAGPVEPGPAAPSTALRSRGVPSEVTAVAAVLLLLAACGAAYGRVR